MTPEKPRLKWERKYGDMIVVYCGHEIDVRRIARGGFDGVAFSAFVSTGGRHFVRVDTIDHDTEEAAQLAAEAHLRSVLTAALSELMGPTMILPIPNGVRVALEGALKQFHQSWAEVGIISMDKAGMELARAAAKNPSAEADAALGKCVREYWLNAKRLIVDGERPIRAVPESVGADVLVYLWLHGDAVQRAAGTWRTADSRGPRTRPMPTEARAHVAVPNHLRQRRRGTELDRAPAGARGSVMSGLALTLHPPWSYAVTWWRKDCENRTWHPDQYGLGPGDTFAIHAGVLHPPKSGRAVGGGVEWQNLTATLESLVTADLLPGGESSLCRELGQALERNSSAIVAVATLDHVSNPRTMTDTLHNPDADPAWANPWRDTDQYGWMLRNVIPILPIPCKGSQKLWRVSDDLRTMIRDRLRECPSCLAGFKEVLATGHRDNCILAAEMTAPWSLPPHVVDEETVPF